MKKYLILSLGLLVWTILPQGASAAITGAGDIGDPYIITTCEDLQSVGSYVGDSSHFRLAGTVDCTESATWNSGLGFDPIPNFAGDFDGAGFAIDGLTINSGNYSIGLFASVDGDVNIHDLEFTNVSISGNGDVGVLFGTAYVYYGNSFTLNNISVEGEVVASNNNLGGLIGYIEVQGAEATANISNIYTSVGLFGTGRMGGFIGGVEVMDGAEFNIDNVYTEGELNSSSGYTGGLIGYIDVESAGYLDIENVSSEFDEVSGGGNDRGGLIGRIYASDQGELDLRQGTSTFNLLPGGTYQNTGGIVGYAEVYSEGEVDLRDLIAQGTFDASIRDTGGIVGSVFLEDGGEFDISTDDMDNNVVDIAFNNVQYNVGGVVGKVEKSSGAALYIEETYFWGTFDSEDDAYSVGGIIGYDGGESGSYTEIDDVSVNLTLEDTYQYSIGGIIGQTNETHSFIYIYDVDVDISVTTEDDDPYNVGGIVGYLYAQSASEIYISEVDVSGEIESTDGYLGGFVGYADLYGSSLEIYDAQNDGMDISGGNEGVGGAIGYVYSDTYPADITLNGVEVSGTLYTPDYYIGGLIGYLYGSLGITGMAEIYNSSVSADISTDNGSQVGGLIGYAEGYSIEIEDTEFTGNIYGGNEEIGGFIGYLDLYEGADLEIEYSYAGGEENIIEGEYNQGSLIGYAEAYENAEIRIADNETEFYFPNTTASGTVGGLIGYLYTDPAAVVLEDNDTIVHLYNPEDDYYQVEAAGGFFGEMDLYEGSSLEVDGGSIDVDFDSNSSYQGGIVGYLYGNGSTTASFTDIEAEVNIRRGTECLGGLIGYVYLEGDTFPLSVSDSSINTTFGTSSDPSLLSDGSTGGVVGCAEYIDDFSIDRVFSNMELYGSGGYYGGLVGYADSDTTVNVTDSYATGSITTSGDGGYIGGLLGEIDNVTNVSNSYANVDIAASTIATYIGGLVGYIGNGGSIENSFSAGSVEGGTLDTVTGFLGIYPSGDVTLSNNFYDRGNSEQNNCSWDGSTPNNEEGECEAVNTIEEMDETYFFDSTIHPPLNTWDFEGVWSSHAEDYPTLQIFTPIPTVETNGATSITQTTATIHGNAVEITGDVEYAEYGVVYAPSSEEEDLGDESNYESYFSETFPIEEGSFTVDIEELECGTSYDYKVFLGREGPRLYAANTETFTTESCMDTFTLSTETIGTGTGEILVSPAQEEYDEDSEVDLTAVADEDSTFKGWSGCSTSHSTSITVVMDEDKTCTATFNTASSTTVVRRSGGGGGSRKPTTNLTSPAGTLPTDLSSLSTSDLEAIIKKLTEELNALLKKGTTPQTPSGASGEDNGATPRNLSLGMTGPDVLKVQGLLVAKNTGPAALALKNHGLTELFGPLTQAAVIEFQKANNITPSIGIVGPLTRAALGI